MSIDIFMTEISVAFMYIYRDIERSEIILHCSL